MKNKLLKILALTVCLIASLFMLTACNNAGGGAADNGAGGSQGGDGGHTHAYTEEIEEEKFLKEAATCEHGNIYYYSCECGEKGVGTFEAGRALEHVYDQKVYEEKYLEYEGDCETKATYYYSCVCGSMGTDVFESDDELPGHEFEDGYCIICGNSENREPEGEPEE